MSIIESDIDKKIAALEDRIKIIEHQAVKEKLDYFIGNFETIVQDLKREKLSLKEFTNAAKRIEKSYEGVRQFMHTLGQATFDLDIFKPDPKEEKQRIAYLEKEISEKDKRIKQFESTLKGVLGEEK